MINGATQLIMMKADVLNRSQTIKVCTHYQCPNGELTEQLPFDLLTTEVKPVYQDLTVEHRLTDAGSFGNVTRTVLAYVDFLEAQLNCPSP
jgi:adenylosuccinate synthase